jgi:peptide-methionine (R)-S-oxide reductase
MRACSRPFTFLIGYFAAASTCTCTSSAFRPHSLSLLAQQRANTRSKICLLRSKSRESDNEDVKMQTWNPLRLAVLRLGLTEPMGTSPLNYGKYEGQFLCAYCGHTLFDSTAKYDSGSGWPSFWRSAKEGAIAYEQDGGRLECRCSRCKSHLGHVFLDGPRPTSVEPSVLLGSPISDPRGSNENSSLPRFCINGAALVYEKQNKPST